MTEGETVALDEGIREGTTPDRLARLQPAFSDEATAERFPEIRWVVMVGSSSQVSGGARPPPSWFQASRPKAVAPRPGPGGRQDGGGDDPIVMLTEPIPATGRVLARAGPELGSLDAVEVNEAFAPVVLAWQAKYGADPKLLNA